MAVLRKWVIPGFIGIMVISAAFKFWIATTSSDLPKQRTESKTPRVASLLPVVGETVGIDEVSSYSREIQSSIANKILIEILGRSDSTRREQDLLALFERWAQSDAMAAYYAVQSLNGKGVRPGLIAECVGLVFKSLSEEVAASEVWSLADSLDANYRIVGQATLVECLTESNLESALYWFSKITSSIAQQQTIYAIVTKSSQLDMPATIMWIGELQSQDIKRNAINHLIELALEGSDNLQPTLKELSDPICREAVIKYEAARIARLEFDTLLSWSEGLPEVEGHIAIQAGFEAALGGNLDQALEISEKHASLLSPSSWRRLTLAMAEQDSVNASKWVLKQDSAKAPDIVEALMEQWLATEPLAASQWAVNLKPGAFRDQAAHDISDYLIRMGDFEDARAWVEEIEQPALKDSILNRLTSEEE